MSNVDGSDWKYSARKATSMKTDPKSVYRKNFTAAYSRRGPPQMPIMKYIGTSTSSQKMKNSTRSNAMKQPDMPVCSISIRARNARGLPGSSM